VIIRAVPRRYVRQVHDSAFNPPSAFLGSFQESFDRVLV
jgi:hypothetical protein